jgi:hypothetical protein
LLLLGLAAFLFFGSRPDPEVEAKLRGLEERARLAASAAGVPPAAQPPLPDPADWNGTGADVLALMDGVGLYRKNGLVEVYGGALRPRQSGPIRVARTEVEVSHERALVAWSPDASPVLDATHLLVELAEPLEHGTLRVGLVLDDEATVAFEEEFGRPAPSPEPPLLEPLVAEELTAALDGATVLDFDEARGERLLTALPPALLAWFRSHEQPIRTWYLELEGAAGQRVALEKIALVRPVPPAASAGVRLAGSPPTAASPSTGSQWAIPCRLRCVTSSSATRARSGAGSSPPTPGTTC